MKKIMYVVAVLAAASVAMAAPGDSWILPVAELQGGGWVTLTGAGYGGADAYRGTGPDGVRRIYWKTDGTTMPTTPELYTIEFYAPTSGPGDWQPIESQFNGSAGEQFPIEPGIPWAGQWGTNHQWIGSQFAPSQAGTWRPTGPGPQAPADPSYYAPGNGIYMWLKKGSWLYAKWDFPWSIDRAWSALRITQVTPEPASLLLLGLGGLFLRRRRG